MKLLSIRQFLDCPPGTIYRIGRPWAFEPLSIKGITYPNTVNDCGDWICMEFGEVDADSSEDRFRKLERAKERLGNNHLPLDLELYGRDGLADDGRVVLVFEPEDVDALIACLQQAKADAAQALTSLRPSLA